MHSKIGFHVGVGGSKNGLGSWEQNANQQGIPFGLKSTDEYGILLEATNIGLQYGVSNWLIFRFTQASGKVSREVPNYEVDPKTDAPALAQEVINKLPPEFNKTTWLELINEPRDENSPGDVTWNNLNATDYLGEWCYEAAKYLNDRGYKFVGPSFNAGRPGRQNFPVSDAVVQYSQPGMLKYLRYCAENPELAGLSIHDYSWDLWEQGETANDWIPELWGRWQAAIAAADLNNIPRSFPIFVTEYGFNLDKSPIYPNVIPYLDGFNEMVAKFPQVKFAAGWTLQGGWGQANETVLTWLQYDIKKQFNEGQQPAKTHELFGGTLPNDDPTEPSPEIRSFEIGWTTLTDRLQEPTNFKLTVIPPGQPLWYDSRIATGTVEAKHLKCLEQVPSNQCVGGVDPLILDGLYCFKIQAVNMASGTSLTTTFPAGGRVTVPINVHWQQDQPNEVNDVFVTLLLNGVEVDRLQHPELRDRTWMELSGEAEGPITAELRFQTSWPNSRDCFTDLWRLEKMDCRGVPRVQYGRKYILLPPSVISADWAEAAVRGSMNQRITIGYSADDAGIGDLNVREVIAVNPSHWGGDLRAFYEQYYPGITYTQIDVVTPADLETKLRAIFDPATPGFDGPVGNTTGEVYSPGWFDANPIGNQYVLNGSSIYHTGSDLNLNVPVFDSDKFAPVYSIGSGVVTHAGVLGGTWGKVVVTKHDGSPTVYSRHAHLDNFTVSVGQTVTKGQQIGRIGNAEGQLPFHDHFDISLTNILQTNPGYWPGVNLNGIMQHFVEPRSLIKISRVGFINKTVYVKSSANFRSGPTTNFRIYKILEIGTQLTVLGEIDGYYLVRTSLNEYGFVSISLTQDAPIQVGNARFGLHSAADPGDISDAELDAFRVARVSLIKVLSAHSGNSIAKLNTQHPNVPFIIRAFLDFGGRIITPTQFFNDTINDIQRALSNIDDREIWLEIANEPNLTSEGLGASWANGTEFNTWLLQTLQLYKNVLQGVKYLYPGLSPQLTQYRAFLNDSMASAVACDGVAVHTYWSDTYSMNQALTDTVDYYVTKFGNKPLWVTEASHNKAGPTPTQKGNQYIAFHQALKQRPSVQGVTYFVASASNLAFGWGPGGSAETWVGTEIPNVVAIR